MRASGDVYELSARVVRRIQADLPRDASEIRRALARTRLPLVPPEHAVLQEHIHASVLRLARGDRRRFD